MTSRQSGWHKPSDAQGSSTPGWGTNQLPGHFPLVGRGPGSRGGRAQCWLASCMTRREPPG